MLFAIKRLSLHSMPLLLILCCFYSPSILAGEDEQSGIRIGLLIGQSNLDVELELNGGSFDFSVSDDVDLEVASFYLGYHKVRTKKIGFATAVTISNLSSDGGNIQNIMLEGNATYGISHSSTHLFAGLNASKFGVDGNYSDGFDIGYGVQVGAGFQFLKPLSFDMRYLVTRHTFDENNVEATLLSHGFRLGILASF